jgi:soluble lytic murein transglycosylase-like protein
VILRPMGYIFAAAIAQCPPSIDKPLGEPSAAPNPPIWGASKLRKISYPPGSIRQLGVTLVSLLNLFVRKGVDLRKTVPARRTFAGSTRVQQEGPTMLRRFCVGPISVLWAAGLGCAGASAGCGSVAAQQALQFQPVAHKFALMSQWCTDNAALKSEASADAVAPVLVQTDTPAPVLQSSVTTPTPAPPSHTPSLPKPQALAKTQTQHLPILGHGLVSRQASNVGGPARDDFAGQGANHSDTRRYREDLQRSPAGSVPQDDRHLRLDATLARRAVALVPEIERVAKAYQIDPLLLHAIAHVESRHNPDAVSHAGALGLMQVMPATARRFGVLSPHTALRDPSISLEVSSRYLKNLQQRFDNNLSLVIAAYNAGEGAVEKYGRRVPPYKETRGYVRDVLAHYRLLVGLRLGAERSAASTL